MITDVNHSPQVSLDSQHDLETDQSQSPSHSDTASLLKSFIKENLRGSYESTGGASSSDESSEMDLRRYRSDSTPNDSQTYLYRNSFTPEPQPLTRSNVTAHDGIWRTDIEEDGPGGSASATVKPISLSPPLKGLRMVPQEEEGLRRPWERGLLEQSLSDAESDHSYSSQDTMILKTTEEAARGHLKYLERYENARGFSSNPGHSRASLVSGGRLGSGGMHAAPGRMSPGEEPGTSGERGASPSRRVRFASDVEFQESDLDPVAAAAAPPQRCLNVDYARLLGRTGGEVGDQDDGYESTDNASSTSSSSNGTEQATGGQAPAEGSGGRPSSTPASIKTNFGYVDCSKMPSFRRMNMELRRKAVTKSAEVSAKSSVEDKLRALCIDTEKEGDEQNPEPVRSPNGGGGGGERFDFNPRDSSSPVLHAISPPPALTSDGAYQIGSLDIIGRTSEDSSSSLDNYSHPYTTDAEELSQYSENPAMSDRINREGLLLQGGESVQIGHPFSARDTVLYPSLTDYNSDNKTPVPIPEQPRRPAPVLRDNKSSLMRSFNSTGNINAIHSEQSMGPSHRPMSEVLHPTTQPYFSSPASRPLSDMYRSQPHLQTNSGGYNLGTMSSMFRSEPQLQREEVEDPDPNFPGRESGTIPGFAQHNVYHVERSQSPYQSPVSHNTAGFERPYTSPEGTYRSNSPYRVESPSRLQQGYRPASPQRPHSPRTVSTPGYRPASPARSASPSVNSERDGSDTGSTTSPWHHTPSSMGYEAQRSTPQHPHPQQDTATDNQSHPQACDIPGVYVYRSNAVHQTTSDENLNTSGSTGSNDSGIEHSSVDTHVATGGLPQPLCASEARGRRAPVNYTLDDTSRDPMGLVEKVKRRRDGSPMGRGPKSTLAQSKGDERGAGKNPLLCQPGEFSKDLSRMRTHIRVSPAGSKMQPMKALPINTEQGWNDKLDTTANRMLDSQRSKMKDEYARYLQLYSKFKKENGEERAMVDEQGAYEGFNSRTLDSPESQSSTLGFVENPLYGSRTDATTEAFGSANQALSTPAATKSPPVKYMRTADIYKMLEQQRGPPRVSRSQPTTPTKITAPEWGFGNSQVAQRMNGSCESISSERYADYDRTYNYNDHGDGKQYGNPGYPSQEIVGGNSRGGATMHAKNAEIYNLYTGSTLQRHYKHAADGRGTIKERPNSPSSLHV